MLTENYCSDNPTKSARHRRARQRDRLTKSLMNACNRYPDFGLIGPAHRFTQVFTSGYPGPAPTVACCEILYRHTVVTVVVIPRRLFHVGPTVRFVMEAAGKMLGLGEAVMVMSERDVYLLDAGRIDHLIPYFETALSFATSAERTAVDRSIGPPRLRSAIAH